MINVLFFAELQDAVGKEQLRFDAAGLTVKELIDKYLATYQLSSLDKAMVAINEEYAQADTELAEGDTVAFIPPVSGG